MVIEAGLGLLETTAWIGGGAMRQLLREHGARELVFSLRRDAGGSSSGDGDGDLAIAGSSGGAAAVACAGLELVRKLHVDYSDRAAAEPWEAPRIVTLSARPPVEIAGWAEQCTPASSGWDHHDDVPGDVWSAAVGAAMQVLGSYSRCFIPAYPPRHSEAALVVLMRAACSSEAARLVREQPLMIASIAGYAEALRPRDGRRS